MAKAISHKITTTEKITLKGKLNDDTSIITVTEDKSEIDRKLIDFIQNFANKNVEITITEKTEEIVE